MRCCGHKIRQTTIERKSSRILYVQCGPPLLLLLTLLSEKMEYERD